MQKLSEMLKIFSNRKTVKQDSPAAKRPGQSNNASVNATERNVVRDNNKDPQSYAKPSDKQIYSGVYGNWNDMVPKPTTKDEEQPKPKEVDPVTLAYKDDKRLNRRPTGDFWK